MGNTSPGISSFDSSHRNGNLIQVDKNLHKSTQYGHAIPEPQYTTNTSNNSSFKLQDLYPYITYNASINHIASSLTLLENIANIISIYAGIKKSINKSFSFKVHIDKSKIIQQKNSLSLSAKPYFNYIAHDENDDIFTSILCGCSWNGLVYLITPINNKRINAKLYMIDGGYFAPKSKQQSLKFEFEFSKYSLDPNVCCVVSHIIDGSNTSGINPRSSMIIDGIIFVNSRLDTIYGYHTVNDNKGLFVLKQFNSTTTTTMAFDHDTDYNIISVDKDETIINVWRQNIDAFVLTSKFNLYGIRIDQNSFQMAKICVFKQALTDIKDVEKYTNCWYDIDNKLLFLVYKNTDTQSVQFKIYESDRLYTNYYEESESDGTVVWDKYSDASSVDMQIPKSLEFILNNTYMKYNKSVMFYHKPSDTFLLFFGAYLIQISIDFKGKKLTTVNVGMVDDIDFDDRYKHDTNIDIRRQEIRRDVMRLNNDRIADHLMQNMEMQNESINSELINATPLPAETTINDHIIGYDELRSCIILNFNQYQKELSTLYKFEVSIMRATDFVSEWKKLLPFPLQL